MQKKNLWPEESLTFGLICPLGMPLHSQVLTSTHQYSHLPSWYALCTHRLPRGSTILPLPPPPAQVSPRQQPCYPDEGSVALIIISSMASAASSPCTCAATRDASTHFEFGANLLNYGSFWEIQHPDTDTHYFLTIMCCDSQLSLDNDLLTH